MSSSPHLASLPPGTELRRAGVPATAGPATWTRRQGLLPRLRGWSGTIVRRVACWVWIFSVLLSAPWRFPQMSSSPRPAT